MADKRAQGLAVEEQMQGLVQCPKCGHSNAEGTRYCDNCGASLVDIAPQQARRPEETKRGLFGRLFGRGS